jgi:DNA-binding protein
MGESADKTRDEIVQLRQDMAAKIAALRKAAERPVRIARMAAVVTVAVIIVGGVAVVAVRARHRAQERSLKGRARTVAKAVSAPEKTLKKARKKLADQAKDSHPLYEKILTGAARSAATAAIPIVLRKLQQRAETAPAGAKRT